MPALIQALLDPKAYPDPPQKVELMQTQMSLIFLAMDLDHYGRNDLSDAFINACVNLSRDEELKTPLNFNKCYRAYVRGKVKGFKLDDPHISSEDKAGILTVARSYFKLAESYL